MLRLANYDRDFQHGNDSEGAALTWKRFPFSLGELRENRQGDLPTLAVNVSNVTSELMAWIDEYKGLVGQEVTLMKVHSGYPGDAPFIDYAADVTSCEVNSRVAIFTLGSPKLARQIFPANRWLTQCGVLRYGDADCGYVIPAVPTEAVGGGFSTCPRSLEACRLRGDDEEARGLTRLHPRRFAGAPGIRSGNP
jgi:phage-related protein